MDVLKRVHQDVIINVALLKFKMNAVTVVVQVMLMNAVHVMMMLPMIVYKIVQEHGVVH